MFLNQVPKARRPVDNGVGRHAPAAAWAS